jgi:hypothetical protein
VIWNAGACAILVQWDEWEIIPVIPVIPLIPVEAQIAQLLQTGGAPEFFVLLCGKDGKSGEIASRCVPGFFRDGSGLIPDSFRAIPGSFRVIPALVRVFPVAFRLTVNRRSH